MIVDPSVSGSVHKGVRWPVIYDVIIFDVKTINGMELLTFAGAIHMSIKLAALPSEVITEFSNTLLASGVHQPTNAEMYTSNHLNPIATILRHS